jgi:hypothetical protein
MDDLRHHGEVRRFLPRVTVEEIDDAELLEAVDAGTPPSDFDDDGEPDRATP